MPSVVQPGTVLLPDTFPLILKLPKWMQPWHGLAKKLAARESKVHRDFITEVKNQEAMMSAPDCYGKTLLKVSRESRARVGLTELRLRLPQVARS